MPNSIAEIRAAGSPHFQPFPVDAHVTVLIFESLRKLLIHVKRELKSVHHCRNVALSAVPSLFILSAKSSILSPFSLSQSEALLSKT